MPQENLTLGDVLPEKYKSDYPDVVLKTTMDEAYNIVYYNEPPSGGLSNEEVEDISEIYNLYQTEGQKGDGNAYWNKSEDDNKAYWSKD